MVCYVAEEAQADAVIPQRAMQEALSLAGVRHDLDWDARANILALIAVLDSSGCAQLALILRVHAPTVATWCPTFGYSGRHDTLRQKPIGLSTYPDAHATSRPRHRA